MSFSSILRSTSFFYLDFSTWTLSTVDVLLTTALCYNREKHIEIRRTHQILTVKRSVSLFPHQHKKSADLKEMLMWGLQLQRQPLCYCVFAN